MYQQTGMDKLNSPEACAEFRSRYYGSALKAAYSVTGSRAQAHKLTEQLFENMELRFRDVSLPAAVDLYIVSQVNLMYAKVGFEPVRKERASAEPVRKEPVRADQAPEPPKRPDPAAAQNTPPAAAGAASAPPPFMVGQTYYLQQPIVLQTGPITFTAAAPNASAPPPQAAAQAEAEAPEANAKPAVAAHEEPAPPPAKKGEVYDPSLTELWVPDMSETPSREQEPQQEPQPPAAEAQTIKEEAPSAPPPADGMPEDLEAEDENQRSIPLTITNTFLFIASVAAALFLLWQAGALSWLI